MSKHEAIAKKAEECADTWEAMGDAKTAQVLRETAEVVRHIL